MFEFDLTPLTTASPYEECASDGGGGEIYRDQVTDFVPNPKRGCSGEPVCKRLHLENALHPLSQDEATTYCSMLAQDENTEIFVMPNHRIDPSGNIRGFLLWVDKEVDCANLPITRDMYKGTTLVECDPGDRSIHPEVIRLLNDPASVKATVLRVLAEIAAHPPNSLVSIDCMPICGDTENKPVTVDDCCAALKRSNILLENLISERIGHQSATQRGRDSRSWNPDMPTSVGLYHAYVRSRDTGKREHKAFLVVSGGCRRASEQFYNLNLDLIGQAMAGEVESCEESWWLRRTSSRSRCHTIKLFADALKLDVPTAEDIYAFKEGVSIPVYTTDTLSNDLSLTDDGRVAIFNEACDVTAVRNGILCEQHPSEGVWLFQGSHQSSIGSLSNFGGGFGTQELCGAFPTGTFSMYEDTYQGLSNYRQSGTLTQQREVREVRLNLFKEKPSTHVIYYNAITGVEIESKDIDFENKPSLLKWDEAFISQLTSHGWLREYQIIELIPILNALEI